MNEDIELFEGQQNRSPYITLVQNAQLHNCATQAQARAQTQVDGSDGTRLSILRIKFILIPTILLGL
jgi:hypothetical protein